MSYKSELIQHIERFLYTKPRTYLRTQLLSIAERNMALRNAPHNAFYYKGEVYFRRLNKRTDYVKPLPLHHSLVEEMDRILAQSADTDMERDYVMNYITAITRLAAMPQMLYTMLPSGLHSIINQVTRAPIDPVPLTEPLQERYLMAMKYNGNGPDLVKRRLMQNLVIG